MRHVFLFVTVVLFCASAAAQSTASVATSNPSPTPFPDGAKWIGRNEIPWTFPEDVALSTVSFSSPVVQQVLSSLGIPFVPMSKSQLKIVAKAHYYPKASIQTQQTTTMLSMVSVLKTKLGTVQLLSVQDQSAVVKAMLASWSQFYGVMGEENSVPSESHFGRMREKLMSELATTGLTSALLDKCEQYRQHLKSAADTKSSGANAASN